MKYKLPLIASLTSMMIFTGDLYAISVDYVTSGSRYVRLSSGGSGYNGAYVQLGYLTNESTVPSSLADLNSNFNSVHQVQTINSGPPFFADGYFGGTFASTPTTVGKEGYVLVVRTASDAAPASDLSNVLDYGLFTSASFVFPATGPGLNINWGMDSVDTAPIGSFDSTGLILTAVPEPSTYAAMAGVAVLGLAIYRRRK